MALLLAAGAAVLAGYAYHIQAQAESLLKDVTALRLGSSTQSDVQQLAKRHNRYLVSQTYSDGVASTTFEVKNGWLSALKLEPPALFGADVKIRDGHVYHISAWLFRAMNIFPTFQGSAGIVDEYTEYTQDAPAVGHYGFPTPVGKPYLRVQLDSHATSSQRQHAWDFSFRCLVKPAGGCDLPCDYLPSAWEDWKAYLNEVGFSDVFNQHYPNSKRCGGSKHLAGQQTENWLPVPTWTIDVITRSASRRAE
jgi:hypothetical protein